VFLQLLRREKRRADRTRAPLSILVYRFCHDGAQTEPGRDQLQEIIAASARETDIVGHLNGEAVAVLCPDTNEAGTHRLVQKIASQCGDLRVSVETAVYPDHHFEGLASGTWSAPEGQPLFADTLNSSRQGGYRLKRVLDIVGASLAIVLFAPVMLATALLVALSSPGPIIFRQTRLGQFGLPFHFYKFRSMRCDADDSIHRKYVQSLIKGENEKVNQGQGSDEPLYKIKADPRITRVGHFIRKTSLDELPQLFNVLNGDMSLVGPRPPIPYEASDYQSWHLRRVLDVKPGITGLWQVEGRSRVSFDEMVRMDLRYVRSCSLAVDIRILFKTALVMLRGDGAR
jgi:exopolysaccharide biosynthesis polyprenyl glycosylphosphotransferase